MNLEFVLETLKAAEHKCQHHLEPLVTKSIRIVEDNLKEETVEVVDKVVEEAVEEPEVKEVVKDEN